MARSNAERQARWRARRTAEMKRLREVAGGNPVPGSQAEIAMLKEKLEAKHPRQRSG